MPTVFMSQSTALSAVRVRDGIDASVDIDLLVQTVEALKTAEKWQDLLTSLEAIQQKLTRTPTLKTPMISAANTAIATPSIAAPGLGKRLVLLLAGWYNGTPTGGVLTITGSDGIVYLSIPVTSSGTGFLPAIALPVDIGCTIALSAGGPGVVGSLNYAVAIEVA